MLSLFALRLFFTCSNNISEYKRHFKKMNYVYKLMKMKKILLLITLFSIIPISIFAQGANEEKFRLAESYEKSGDYNNSSRIYEELYNQNPKIDRYFLGLVRSFKAQNRFSELLPYINNRLEISKSIELYSLKAEVLWRLGNTKEANTMWDATLELGQNSLDAYTYVLQSQISLRLFDKAIATIENARSYIKDNSLLADELSQLYIAIGNYSKGAIEILNFFEKTNNLPQTQGRLQALMANDSSIIFISDMLKKKYNSSSSLNYLKLYAWFLRAIDDFKTAFDVYKSIDEQQKSNGREILRFAEDSRADEQFEVALEAFSYVIDLGKKNPYRQNALYGYTRTLEAKLRSSKDISNDFLYDIIRQYKSIAEDYPNSNLGFESRYRMALIYFEYLKNQDEAVKELNLIVNNLAGGKTTAAANILLGKIYVSQNNLVNAKIIFENVINSFRKNFPQEVEFAEFELGQIHFFEGNIDSAKIHYGNATLNLKSAISNDALLKIILLENNKDFEKELISLGKAELFEKQFKYEEAVNIYKQFINNQNESNIAEISLLRLASIEQLRSNEIQARIYYLQLIENFPESIYSDFALLSLANSFFSENNNDEALKYYTEILSNYPRSIYLNEAREKIRKIRSGLKM